MAWGINPNASAKEKIKAEMNDYLKGQNSCGVISYATYSVMYDVTMDLLDKMYEQGVKDGKASKDADIKTNR